MSKRHHNGMGTLYKRGTDGKDYPPAAKVEGTFYVRILCQDGARRPYMALTPCIWMQAPSVRV